MKVFALEIYREDAEDTDKFFRLNNDSIICFKGLCKLFVLPKDTDKIWISVRKSPAKGFIEAKLKCNFISWYSPCKLLIGKRKIEVLRDISRILAKENIYHNDTFYFKVEY